MDLTIMAISSISIICYILGEILLVKHNILTFYLFIISNILVVIQLFLNHTIFQNPNIAVLQLFSLIMSIIAIYNWKRIKYNDKK
jgi:Kef-type K+ transport system membrane component KefB